MNILKEKTLPLLKRKRIVAEIEHFKKPTPSKKEIIKMIADGLKTKEDNISLLHAYSHFGREKTKIIANIYESKESLDAIEKINKRKKKEEAEKKQEAPKEQLKTEKPKEEKK